MGFPRPSSALVLLALLSSAAAQRSWVHRTAVYATPRNYHALAYDSLRHEVVLFGGFSNSGYLSDTWTFNGASWSLRNPKQSPPARGQYDMVYDSRRHRVVLFGGAFFSITTVVFGDTWEYDGNTWIQRKPITSPPARFNHALAYDSARGRVVLFGGTDSKYGSLADTWEWDGANWSRRAPPVSPPGRMWHDMVYDAARRRTVLFGGVPGRTANDTWEWDGTTWTQRFPATPPPPRKSPGLAYDSARGRVVLFGGNGLANGSRTNYLNDTWEWNGAQWTELSPPASPPLQEEHRMVYDAARGRVVLFGGRLQSSWRHGDTWELAPTDLVVGTHFVSLSQSGVQTLVLDAGTANQRRFYMMLGTATGTLPGTRIGSVLLPLNPGPYFMFTATVTNSPLLANSFGVLDPAGRSAVTFRAIPQIPTSLIGLRLYHAYVVLNMQPFGISMVSNAVPVTFTR